MGAHDLLADLRAQGLTISLTEIGLSASPRAALTDDYRAAIRTNRASLISALEAEGAAAALLFAAINRCCDAPGDDPSNRAALIADCERLAPDQQADLREHFDQEAARFGGHTTLPPKRLPVLAAELVGESDA